MIDACSTLAILEFGSKISLGDLFLDSIVFCYNLSTNILSYLLLFFLS